MYQKNTKSQNRSSSFLLNLFKFQINRFISLILFLYFISFSTFFTNTVEYYVSPGTMQSAKSKRKYLKGEIKQNRFALVIVQQLMQHLHVTGNKNIALHLPEHTERTGHIVKVLSPISYRDIEPHRIAGDMPAYRQLLKQEVRKIQQQCKLKVDGWLGMKTLGCLEEIFTRRITQAENDLENIDDLDINYSVFYRFLFYPRRPIVTTGSAKKGSVETGLFFCLSMILWSY